MAQWEALVPRSIVSKYEINPFFNAKVEVFHIAAADNRNNNRVMAIPRPFFFDHPTPQYTPIHNWAKNKGIQLWEICMKNELFTENSGE